MKSWIHALRRAFHSSSICCRLVYIFFCMWDNLMECRNLKFPEVRRHNYIEWSIWKEDVWPFKALRIQRFSIEISWRDLELTHSIQIWLTWEHLACIDLQSNFQQLRYFLCYPREYFRKFLFDGPIIRKNMQSKNGPKKMQQFVKTESPLVKEFKCAQHMFMQLVLAYF